MSHKSGDFLFKDVNPIPSVDEDLLCQLLNQLELNLNDRKPFVNQLLGIISLNDQRVMASSSNGYGDVTLVDEVDNSSDLVTSKTDSVNPNLSDEKEVTSVFNSIKAIETGGPGNKHLFNTELSGDSSGAAIYNSFQAEMVDVSGDLVSQVSPADLSFNREEVDYRLARSFLACWIFFYMSGNDFYRYSSFNFISKTSILSQLNAVMIYILIIIRQVQLDYYFFGLDANDNHVGFPLITSLVPRDLISPYGDDLIDYLAAKDFYCLGREFKEGFSLMGVCRTSLDPAYKKSDVFRQIELDDYLFSQDWKSLDFALLSNCHGACLSISIIMIDNSLCFGTLLKLSFVLHTYGVVEISEQCEEIYHRFNQNWKDNIVLIRLSINFYKTLLFKVVIKRQIELDLYLFSRVWNGLTLLTLIEYDQSRMLTAEYGVICFVYHISGLLIVGSSEDGSLQSILLSAWDALLVFGFYLCWTYLDVRPFSQFTPTGARAGSTYEWHRLKMNLANDHKWLCWMFHVKDLEDFFTMFFFSHQYTSWNSLGVMWDLGSHLCWAYLDVRPLSQFTPSARAWAVSTYIWRRWDLIFLDVHKLNDVLLFGGNWFCFTFVSHLPSFGRNDASLYVTRGSFMRIKRQHIHVLKEVPVVVHCNHGRSGADEDFADTFVSFSVLDRVRISTSLLGSINSCLDTYLYFPFNVFILCCSVICCNGSASSLVSTNCDG